MVKIDKNDEAFNDLRMNRKNLRNQIKDNEYEGIYIFLSNIYSNLTHFIYETIQNADDCNAKYYKLSLFNDRVEIRHNGEPFTIEDIKSITNIKGSKKKNKIGYKGIGFKSVFVISNRPAIYSANYNFEIEDYIVPIAIEAEGISKKHNETLIVLPFKNDINVNKVYEMIKDKLQSLNVREFIFLNNIVNLTFMVNNKNIKSFNKNIQYLSMSNVKKFILKTGDEVMEYLVINDECDEFTKIAFNIKEHESRISIIPELNSSIYSFFPTEAETKLNFFIQGRYDTSDDRKTIDFVNIENNKIILAKTIKLFEKCISIFKDLKILNVNTFKALPIYNKTCSENSIYKVFNDVLIKKIHNDQVLLTNSDEYCSLENALLAEENIITKIFKTELFDKNRKLEWLDDSFKELKDELLEYGLKVVDEDYIVKNINITYIKNMTIEKLILFYKYIFNSRERFLKFAKLEVIKVNDNTFRSFYDKNNNPNIFLKVSNKIDNSMISEFEILTFNNDLYESDQELKEIVLKNRIFNNFNEVNLIKRLLNNSNLGDKIYFDNISKIMRILKKIYTKDNKDEIIQVIKSNLYIKYINLLNGKKSFGLLGNNSTQYYWVSNEVLNLYNQLDSGQLLTDVNNYEKSEYRFIDQEIYNRNIAEELKNNFKELLEACGVSDNILMLEEKSCNGTYNFYIEENNKKFAARQYSPTFFEIVYNPSILYIQDIIANIDYEKSKLLWKILFDFFMNIDFECEGYFINRYGQSKKRVTIKLDIIAILKEFKWIFIDNRCRKPEEVTYNDLKRNGYYLGEDIIYYLDKYKKICNILGIRQKGFSKKESDIRAQIITLNDEELDRLQELIKYIKINRSNS